MHKDACCSTDPMSEDWKQPTCPCTGKWLNEIYLKISLLVYFITWNTIKAKKNQNRPIYTIRESVYRSVMLQGILFNERKNQAAKQ